MRTSRWKASLACVLTVLALAGCSSGSSSGTRAPVADAGADRTVDEGTLLRLAGSGTDPDGAVLTVRWTQVSGPPVTFTDPTVAASTCRLPQVPVETFAIAVLRLTVTNPSGVSAADEVSVTIHSADYVLFRADREEDDVVELYKADVETGLLTKLSPQGAVRGGASWDFAASPDRSRVAYTADSDGDGLYDLHVVTADASERQQVNSGLPSLTWGLHTFQWSPDGAWLAFTVDPTTPAMTELFVAPANGVGAVKVSGALVPGGSVLSYAWSPDGAWLAFAGVHDRPGRSDVYVVRADGSDLQRVHPELAANATAYSPLWSPDGTRLALVISDIATQTSSLYVVVPGGAPVRVSGPIVTGRGVWNPAWSPTGTYLAFEADPDLMGTHEVFAVRADGSDLVKVSAPIDAGHTAYGPLWSPTEDRLVYLSDPGVAGARELFAVLPDASARAKLNAPLVAGRSVWDHAWAHDASRIAWIADQDTDDLFEVYTALPDGTGRVKVNTPITAGERFGALQWSPDASRLVVGLDSPVPALHLYEPNEVGGTRIDGLLNPDGLVGSWSWGP